MDDFESARGALRDEPTEARVQRMWRAIEARRGDVGRPSRTRARLAFGFAVPAMIALALVLVARPATHGPLELATGASMPRAFVAEPAPLRVALSDDSVLRLARGARLDVLETSATAAGFVLREGRVRFEVEPHGPRRWRIDCGPVQVEVVGTVFTITRTSSFVSVEVERGAVAVRGPGVADGVQRLGPGQRLRVEAPPVAATTARPASIVASPPTDPSRTVDSVAPPAVDEAAADAAPLAARRARSAVDALFAQADEARRSGRPSEALLHLGRIVDGYPHDSRASLAAYTMAQLMLDSLGRPADAARAYARSLSLGLPRSMRETAAARRVEALGRAGSAEVDQAGRAYLQQYPDGRHRDAVSRWLAH